ncbi:Kynurenine 3-monooxygenase [Aphelenchoides fujianensis]|nr:Kynurenine 3-monooxygenase [Aphelenchoides fujianensis]KAI6233618.1 Kynurenine 3-monooxygenase [Aphelenchoides fujianensis]
MPKVLIAGAGLVGALNAVFFARRGWDVEVYEQRPDIRQMEHVPGRSINLALSQRGKSALEAVGLRSYIVEKGVELSGRLIHDPDGRTLHRQPYGQVGQHIVSINRRHLNEVMLTEAERFENVRFFFEHKVQKIDLRKRMLVFERREDGEVISAFGDLILACDGAYSAVRRSLMAFPRFDFSQEYIEHGYVELNIGPQNGEFAMAPDGFHLWPRGDFTLIALANTDKTFTVTLFAPFAVFERELANAAQQVAFFRRHFPDALRFLGEQHVVETFERVGRPSALVSIKCKPHGFEDVLLLMGDAAHAMDCLILDEILTEFGDNVPAVVRAYSERRWVDAHTINDLAMYNYNELKDLVNKWGYKMRKKLDLALNRWFPNAWVPLYSMVTFTRMPYREIVKERKRQDKFLSRFRTTAGLMIVAVGVLAAIRNGDRVRDLCAQLKLKLS